MASIEYPSRSEMLQFISDDLRELYWDFRSYRPLSYCDDQLRRWYKAELKARKARIKALTKPEPGPAPTTQNLNIDPDEGTIGWYILQFLATLEVGDTFDAPTVIQHLRDNGCTKPRPNSIRGKLVRFHNNGYIEAIGTRRINNSICNIYKRVL